MRVRRLEQVLHRNIANTERYVNMSMASKRNVLIRIDVLMNMATFSLACGGTIAVTPPSPCWSHDLFVVGGSRKLHVTIDTHLSHS